MAPAILVGRPRLAGLLPLLDIGRGLGRGAPSALLRGRSVADPLAPDEPDWRACCISSASCASAASSRAFCFGVGLLAVVTVRGQISWEVYLQHTLWVADELPQGVRLTQVLQDVRHHGLEELYYVSIPTATSARPDKTRTRKPCLISSKRSLKVA